MGPGARTRRALRPVARLAGRLIWLLDEGLDRLPRREQGRWYRYGHYGCLLRLHRWWFPLLHPDE